MFSFLLFVLHWIGRQCRKHMFWCDDERTGQWLFTFTVGRLELAWGYDPRCAFSQLPMRWWWWTFHWHQEVRSAKGLETLFWSIRVMGLHFTVFWDDDVMPCLDCHNKFYPSELVNGRCPTCDEIADYKF